MTDHTELHIDLLERAMHLERSARRMLNRRGKVKDLTADLKAATDGFTAARVALHEAGMGGHEVEEPPAPAEAVEPHPAFEITP